MSTRATLARNLRFLMDRHQLTEARTASRAKVAQKSVNNILNQNTSPRLEVVEALASSFGLNLWHLIMEDLPDDLIESPTLSELYRNFVEADPELREVIMTLSRRTQK